MLGLRLRVAPPMHKLKAAATAVIAAGRGRRSLPCVAGSDAPRSPPSGVAGSGRSKLNAGRGVFVPLRSVRRSLWASVRRQRFAFYVELNLCNAPRSAFPTPPLPPPPRALLLGGRGSVLGGPSTPGVAAALSGEVEVMEGGGVVWYGRSRWHLVGWLLSACVLTYCTGYLLFVIPYQLIDDETNGLKRGGGPLRRSLTSFFQSLLMRFMLIEPLKYAGMALLPDQIWERIACPR